MRRIHPLLICLALAACGGDRQPSADATASRADSASPAKAASGPAVVTIPYTMVRHPASGAVMPRLTDTSSAPARAVNRQLDSAAAEMRCEEAVVRGYETEFDSEARVTYAADSVFSVYIRVSYYCGTASPTNGANFSVTYDLRTSEPVEFQELWADWERDGQAIARAIFPAQTARADSVARGVLTPDPDDPCWDMYRAETLATGFYLRYSLSDSGFVGELDPPTVAKACGEVVTVPYARLRPFAAPGGVLARVADARSRPR
jgi:hypothetical protein